MRSETIYLKEMFPFLGQDGCDPALTLYLPHNIETMGRQDQKRPCVLVIPGGSYRHVSPREGEPVAFHLLPEGFNVFVLTYNTAPHRFPTQLRQVAAALELIHTSANAWNCDMNRVAIMGFSAGGHLAAHYTNCYDCKEVREVFPESKAVNACVLCYPVITADPAHSHKDSIKNLVGHYPEEESELAFFSCEQQVSDRTPPTFLWHTVTDELVPVKNSLLYADALNKYKIPFEMHIYPNGRHGLATADAQTCDDPARDLGYVKDWLPALKKWLNRIFSIA